MEGLGLGVRVRVRVRVRVKVRVRILYGYGDRFASDWHFCRSEMGREPTAMT